MPRRDPWPREPADCREIARMLRIALTLHPDWKPPERFAYKIDEEYDLVDFVNPLSRMQNHVNDKLWPFLPPGVREMYYLRTMLRALDYMGVAGDCIVSKAGMSEDRPELELLDEAGVAMRLAIVTMITSIVVPQADPRQRAGLFAAYNYGQLDDPPLQATITLRAGENEDTAAVERAREVIHERTRVVDLTDDT